MLGTKARIGFVVPANNTVLEPEMYGLGIDGVSFHAARVVGSRSGESSVEGLKAIVANVDAAIEALTVGGMDIIAYACLSTSLANKGWDKHFAERVAKIAGVPAITAFEATAAAIQHANPQALAVVTPYGPAIHALVAPALEARGIRPFCSRSLNLPGLVQVCRTPPETVRDSVLALLAGDCAGADLVAIFATDLQTFAILPQLRAQAGRAVLSTNQAMISEIARQLGFDLPSFSSPGESAA